MQRRRPWADEVDSSSEEAAAASPPQTPTTASQPAQPARADAGPDCERQTWRRGLLLPRQDDLELDAEVEAFVHMVMLEPDWTHHAVSLALWQGDLRERCCGQELLSPYWHAVVYDLDLNLYVEMELFVRTLASGAWPLPMLTEWQRRLRRLTLGRWLPRSHWYFLIHRINLARVDDAARASLQRLFCLEQRRAARRSAEQGQRR